MKEQLLPQKKKSPIQSWFALIVIPLTIAISYVVFYTIFGAPTNFEGNDPNNHPLPGNYLGIIFKGGVIVPVLMSLGVIVIIFAIERFITIAAASGKGNADAFLAKIRSLLLSNNIDEAISECDKQQGSLGNVVKAGLYKYKAVQNDTTIEREQKVLAIQKDLEEATELELPGLENNLVVIATIASVATLVGLLGTVVGMIKAFAALAQAGAPDSVGLANGISEALINTALGIFASALAILFYNYFTTKIDKITYSIDEAGFSIVRTYSATQK